MVSITPVKNDRREIFGWLAYDWANSAFYTTVVTVLAGPYLTALAQDHVGKAGVVLHLGPFGSITSDNLFTSTLGASIFLQIFLLPMLGSIADFTPYKKKMMACFCYVGVVASSLLFFVSGTNYLWGCLFLLISNICFAASNVFYNSFLVDLTTEDKRDKISSYGYAAGYLGGLVMLFVNLAMINFAPSFGVDKGTAVRISMLVASIWWGVFAAVTFMLVKSRHPEQDAKGKSLVTVGFVELWKTLRELAGLKYTLLFLAGYLLYNDGVQTVILNSSIFLSQELFISKGLESDPTFLLMIFVIAQVCALIGALAFERLSRLVGTKRTIILCLAIWSGIVIFAYGFLQSEFQAQIMAAFIGLVLGPTQALSRSLFSQMIPKSRESAFFGLYEISEKGTSWIGNLVFAVVVGTTGSYRHAILALIVFFVAGMVILVITNTTKAIHAAGNLTPEEVAGK
ncbi:MAG: MFS transporter [Acidobacteria bacterium]|nr:MFS transporter [Acidobacteriota bacterium]MBP9110906.1 MFS transporter [Pyrinomonadaceae bacterium]